MGTFIVTPGVQGPEGPRGIPGPPFAAPANLGNVSGSVVTDCDDVSHVRATLTGNIVLENPINASDGQKVVWELIQGGSGGYGITFGSKFSFGLDIYAVSLTPTVGKRDFLGAVYNQTTNKWYVIALVKGY